MKITNVTDDPNSNPPKSCRASLFHGHGLELTLEELQVPELEDGEVLVRLQCSTLCGSDLHTLQGLRTEPTPTILGHEATGEVVAMVGNIKTFAGSDLSLGDRIVWSVCVSCGECKLCRRGLPQKCVALAKYGHLRAEGRLALSGGFAEYIVLRKGTHILRVPATLPAEVASTANCAVATIMGAYRLLGPPAGKKVLIFGAGMLGLVAAAYADFHGADSITVIDRDANRLATSREFGASAAASEIEGSEVPDQKFDLIIEATGAPAAVQATFDAAAVGGSIVLVGSVMPSPPVQIDPQSLVRRCISLHGLHNYTPDDLAIALQFLHDTRDRYPFANATKNGFPLAELPRAIQFAINHRPLRVAIYP